MGATFPMRVSMTILALIGGGLVAADQPDRPIVPRYRHAETPRPVKREPARKSEVPGALRLTGATPEQGDAAGRQSDEAPPANRRPEIADTRPGAGSAGSGIPAPRRPHTGSDADRRAQALQHGARDAARWSALLLVDLHGRREYYRVGLYDGMREALGDLMLGRREYAVGQRYAWYDPDARNAGAEVGRAAADEQARIDAEHQVEAQFRDLSAPPRRFPRPDSPVYVPELPDIPEPTLQEVFDDYPMRRFDPLYENFTPYLADWEYDAWRIYVSAAYTEFYDADWSSTDSAFDDWSRNRSRSAFYYVLGPHERRWFQEIYNEELALQLAALYEIELARAYEVGFDDGWGYGAFVREELMYRSGYREGFREGVRDGAVTGFQQTYVDSYLAWYVDSFESWSNSARPEILGVRIEDADGDGIFEPGEKIRVDYELVNYGGRAGRFDIAMTGATLAAPGAAIVDLPARSTTGTQGDVGARIADWTQPRTEDRLWFFLADQKVSMPLTVNNPLQIQRRSLQVYRDNLGGALRVEVSLRNIGRHAMNGSVQLVAEGLDQVRPVSLDGGREQRLDFAISGLDPLRLIEGSIGVTLTVEADERRQDLYYHRLPDVVRDLRSPDLLGYMMHLSRGGPAGPAEIPIVQRLMLQRLREDWKVAVMGRGNPYKQDYKNGGTRTALGALVQAYLGERETISEPEVFEGMSRQILALSDTLPGVHPLLRKQMRRLAGELP